MAFCIQYIEVKKYIYMHKYICVLYMYIICVLYMYIYIYTHTYICLKVMLCDSWLLNSHFWSGLQ